MTEYIKTLGKGNYLPEERALAKIVQVQPRLTKNSDTDFRGNTKANERKEAFSFNTEDIFKAKKHEFF